MDSSDEDIWDYKSLNRIRTSQGSRNSSATSKSNASNASFKHKGSQRGNMVQSQPASKNSSKSSDFCKQPIKKVPSTQSVQTSHRSGKSVIKKELGTSRQKSSEKAGKRRKGPLVKTEAEVTPAKCRKTGSGPGSAEREGRCPICQVPDSALSAIDTPSWHLDECQMVVVKKEEECPLGLSCTVMIESHYQRYRHTEIARSSKKKLAQSSQQQYGSVDKAKVSLKFGDDVNLASTSFRNLAEPVIVLSSGTEEESQETSNENEATASLADNVDDNDDDDDADDDDDDLNITHVRKRNRSKNEIADADDADDDDDDLNITHIRKRNRSKNEIADADDADDDDDDLNITHVRKRNRSKNEIADADDADDDDDDLNITHVRKRNRSKNEIADADDADDDDDDLNITHIRKRNRSKNEIVEDNYEEEDDNSRHVKDRTTDDHEASDVDSECELDKTVVPDVSRLVTGRNEDSADELPSPAYVQYDSDVIAYKESFEDLVRNTRSSVGSVHNIDSSDDENRNVSDMLKDILYDDSPVIAEDKLASGKINLFDDIFSADSEGSGSIEPLQDKSVKKRSRVYSLDTEVDEHDSDIEEMDTEELVRNIVQDIDCDIDGTGDASSKTGQAFTVESRSSTNVRQDTDENVDKCHKSSKAGLYSSLIYDTVKHRRCRKDNLPDFTEKCNKDKGSFSSDDDSVSSEELYQSPFKPDTFVDAPGKHQTHKEKVNIDHAAVEIKKEKYCAESSESKRQNKTKDLKRSSTNLKPHSSKKTSRKIKEEKVDKSQKSLKSFFLSKAMKKKEEELVIRTDSESEEENCCHANPNCCIQCRSATQVQPSKQVKDKQKDKSRGDHNDNTSKGQVHNKSRGDYNESTSKGDDTSKRQVLNKSKGNQNESTSKGDDTSKGQVHEKSRDNQNESTSKGDNTSKGQVHNKIRDKQYESTSKGDNTSKGQVHNKSRDNQNESTSKGDTTSKRQVHKATSREGHYQSSEKGRHHDQSSSYKDFPAENRDNQEQDNVDQHSSELSQDTDGINEASDHIVSEAVEEDTDLAGGFFPDGDTDIELSELTSHGFMETSQASEVESMDYCTPDCSRDTVSFVQTVSEKVTQITRNAADILMASSKFLYQKGAQKTAMMETKQQGLWGSWPSSGRSRPGSGQQSAGRGQGQGLSGAAVGTSGTAAETGREYDKRSCPFYKKIPDTCFTVDAFRYGVIPGCKAYVLSHFHYDHYMGLNKKFAQPIYCSQITANLVKQKIRVDARYLHPIPLDTPTLIENVEITLIEANHCPGAVLILFRLRNGRLHLHTGDFRASRDMEQHPALINAHIHTLYLDTTYCDPQYSFPAQAEVVALAIQLVEDAVARNPRTLIVCGTYTIGKERIFTALARVLDCKVCVTRDKKTILDCLEDPDLARRISLRWGDSRLHILPMAKMNPKGLTEHITKNGQGFDSVLGIEPTGWTFSKNLKSLDQIRPKVNKDNIKIYGIPYSEHSSYQEMKRFVQFTKPVKILPTVNNGNHHSRRKMEVIFEAWREVSS